MKRKLQYSLLIALIVLINSAAPLSSVISASFCGSAWTKQLTAKDGSVVGTVAVSHDETNLKFQFLASSNYTLKETYVAVGDSVNDIPHNQKSEPLPSRLQYSHKLRLSVTGDTITIPIADSGLTDLAGVVIVAGADVKKNHDNIMESWAGTQIFTSTSNVRYFTYTGYACIPTGTLNITGNNLGFDWIPSNATHVKLGSFTFSAANEPIEVSSLDALVDFTPSTGSSAHATDFTNLSLYDGTTIVAGPVDVSSITYTNDGLTERGHIRFRDPFDVPIGTRTYTIYGDVSNDLVTADTLQIGVSPTTSVARGNVTGATVMPTPSNIVFSSLLAIRPASLSVYMTPDLPSLTVPAGTNNVDVAHIGLSTYGSGSDVRVTALDLILSTESPVYPDFVYPCSIFNNGIQVPVSTFASYSSDGMTTPGGSGRLVFTISAGNLTIPKETSITLSLKCNVGTAVTSGLFSMGIDTDSVWAIDQQASRVNVSVTPSSGSSITITP